MRLQLTDGYYLHFEQFSRMLQYARENLIKNKISSAEYVDVLGQSPKSVEAFRKMLIEMGVLLPKKFTLTEFGEFVAKHDLFFESLDTLWICHYNISSNPENYVWHRFTNTILPQMENYTREDVYNYFNDLSEYNTGVRAVRNMHKEVKSILNAYTKQQFKKLKLIYIDYENKFQKDKPVEISPLVFLYTLLHYVDKKNINATGLTIDEINSADGLPGKVFNLDTVQINNYLNKLHSMELIRLERFGDLNQIRFGNSLNKTMLLNKIYNAE